MSEVLPRRRWDPAVHAALVRMLEETPPGALAALDWDNTMIRGDIGESVLDHLDRDGRGRMAEYLRLCKVEGKRVGYAWCAFQIAGLTLDEAAALTNRVIEERLADGRIELRPEMIELVAGLHARGWEVWVISASAEPLVRTFAPRYGIAADHVVGMRLAIDPDGRLADRLGGPNTFREGKVEALDRFVGRRPVFAAGDTETDIDMLESAKHRLLMDRGNLAARAAAERGGWWIQPATW